MGLWSRLLRWRSRLAPEVSGAAPASGAAEPAKTVELPAEPFVFECQACGKVFEARRKRPRCPECESPEVSLLSE